MSQDLHNQKQGEEKYSDCFPQAQFESDNNLNRPSNPFSQTLQLMQEAKDDSQIFPYTMDEADSQQECFHVFNLEKAMTISQQDYPESFNKASKLKESAEKLFIDIKFESVLLRGSEERRCLDEGGSQKLKVSFSDIANYELIEVLGKGAYGLVLKVRNKINNETSAIKLLKKEHEKYLLNEVSFIRMNEYHVPLFFKSRLHTTNVHGVIATQDYYGIILDSGIATLWHLKCFLATNNNELSEQEILSLSFELFTKYLNLWKKGICHRDIKPDNILVYRSHEEDLHLIIIDYAFAICHYGIENISGLAGTPGYIPPYIYQKPQSLNKYDLIWGDLFAFGVTILELTIPKILLLADNGISKDVIQEKLESLCNFRFSNNKPYIKFSENFEKYFDHIIKRQNIVQSQDINNIAESLFSNLSDASPKIIDKYEIAAIEKQSIKRKKGFDVLVKEMIEAARTNENLNKKEEALLCYEDIILHHPLNPKKHSRVSEYCDKALALTPCDPLLYSTLATYYYETGNISEMKKMFERGLEVSSDIIHKLILLNNYGCIQWWIDRSHTEYSHTLQLMYDMLIENISECATDILYRCIEGHEGNCDYYGVTINRIDNPMYSLYKQAHTKSVHTKEDGLYPLFFSNFCVDKSSCFLERLKQNQNSVLYNKVESLRSYFSQKKSLFIKPPSNLQLFVNILMFLQLFEEPEANFSTPNLKKFKQEAESLIKNESYLYTLFTEKSEKGIFEELKSFEVFHICVGLTVNYDAVNKDKTWSIGDLVLDNIAILQKFSNSVDLVADLRYFGYSDIISNFNNMIDSIRRTSISKDSIEAMPEALLECAYSITYTVSILSDHKVWSVDYLSIITCGSRSFCETRHNVNINHSLECQEWYKDLPSYFSGLTLPRLKFIASTLYPVHDKQMVYLSQAISAIRALKSLDFSLVHSYMTSKGVTMLAEALATHKGWKELRLQFYYSPNITDSAILSLTNIINELNLTDLTLSFQACGQITFQGLENVEKNSQRLKSLRSKSISLKF